MKFNFRLYKRKGDQINKKKLLGFSKKYLLWLNEARTPSLEFLFKMNIFKNQKKWGWVWLKSYREKGIKTIKCRMSEAKRKNKE